MKISRVEAATALVVIAATLMGVLWVDDDSSAAGNTASARSFRISRQKFTRSLMVSGELAAARGLRVTSPPLRGQGPFAIKALAPEGSYVKPGDLLVQIDNSVLVNNLTTEELNLEKAENDLVKKQAELEIQIKDLEMQLAQNKLALDEAKLKADIDRSLLSLRDWQDYQFAFEKAKKEFDKTSQSLELATKASREEVTLLKVKRDQTVAKIEGFKTNISALEIRATQPGVVLYEIYPPSRFVSGELPRKFQVSDQIFAGWTILSIPDLKDMEVRAYVSEVDGGLLRLRQRARIVADSFPALEFGGALEHIPELAERIGKTSNVRFFVTTIKLDKTDLKFMRPALSVRIEILLDEQVGLVVPRRAVSEDKGKYFVTLVGGERKPVEIRARNSTSFLIDGVAEGAIVQL